MNTNFKALAQATAIRELHLHQFQEQELRGMKHACSLRAPQRVKDHRPPGEFTDYKSRQSQPVSLREKEDHELTSLNDTRVKLVPCWTKDEVTTWQQVIYCCGIVCDTRQDGLTCSHTPTSSLRVHCVYWTKSRGHGMKNNAQKMFRLPSKETLEYMRFRENIV